jgi:CRISPR/Cas system-associated endonuclease Cas1
MQLYLDSYRAFLSVRNGRFSVRLASGEERHFPVREVSAILMTKGMGATTDASLLAIEHDIPVLLTTQRLMRRKGYCIRVSQAIPLWCGGDSWRLAVRQRVCGG